MHAAGTKKARLPDYWECAINKCAIGKAHVFGLNIVDDDHRVDATRVDRGEADNHARVGSREFELRHRGMSKAGMVLLADVSGVRGLLTVGTTQRRVQ